MGLIIFNDKRGTDYNLTVESRPPAVYPARRGEKYQIAGRNGSEVREDNTFENYTQPYKVWIGGRSATSGARDLSRGIAAWLLSSSGYCRLEDSYEPEHFRLARFAGPLNVEQLLYKFGRCTLEFDCKPERYLKSGENAVKLFENVSDLSRPATAKIHNPTEFIAAPLIRITGTGEFLILKPAHHTVDAMEIIVTLDSSEAETIEIDCASYAIRTVSELAGSVVYGEASGKVRYLTHYPTLARLDPGENTIQLELVDVLNQPNIQKFEIVPRWWAP